MPPNSDFTFRESWRLDSKTKINVFWKKFRVESPRERNHRVKNFFSKNVDFSRILKPLILHYLLQYFSILGQWIHCTIFQFLAQCAADRRETNSDLSRVVVDTTTTPMFMVSITWAVLQNVENRHRKTFQFQKRNSVETWRTLKFKRFFCFPICLRLIGFWASLKYVI